MRVVFMGTPDFAVPSLECLFLNHYEIAAVYTQPDSTAGRGRSLVFSPVKQAAINLGLPVVQPVNFKKAETIVELAALKPDVIVVAAFGQILPQQVLDIPKYNCINIHPSLLPKYRGASPVTAAILAGDMFAGTSIMLMDKGLDTGPVLAQGQAAISSWDTTGMLTDKLALVSAQLLLEAIPRWTAGELSPRPQGKAASVYTAMLTKAEGEIDWLMPALEIQRRVRAFQPWPGCYTDWKGKQLKIIEAVHLPALQNTRLGEVAALNHVQAAFGVTTGAGMLGVISVQLEGKRVMSSAEFLRGQPQLVGAVVGQ